MYYARICICVMHRRETYILMYQAIVMQMRIKWQNVTKRFYMKTSFQSENFAAKFMCLTIHFDAAFISSFDKLRL